MVLLMGWWAQPYTQGEDARFLELETLSADPNALCGGSSAAFCALFAPVAAADSTEVTVQVEADVYKRQSLCQTG